MIETWKEVFDGYYAVSDQGRIKRLRCDHPQTKYLEGRILKTPNNKYGYPQVEIHIHGKGRTMYVYAIVAQAFIGPKPPGLAVNHKDGVKTNSSPSNLEYVTPLENVRHAIAMGLFIPRKKLGKRKTSV